MRRTLPAFVWKICAAALMFAAFTAPWVRAQSAPNYPGWWFSQGVLSGTAAPNDFAAANQGQAKNMAGGAVKELDTDLRQFGGAGSQLDQLMATLSGTTAQTDDYLAINLGQLKTILQPFYDRLLAVGYTGTSGPLSTGTYPWIGAGKVANDYAWANLGQLKNLFSFDVKYSSSGGTIPDWWIEKYFPGSTQNGEPSINPSGYVAWSDTVTYLQAYQQGLDPTDPYGGSLPVLTALNWGVITAENPGDISDISVQVTDENGEPIPGAPVTFSIDYGFLMVPGASVSSASQTVQVVADSNGNATVAVVMPWWANADVLVTATVETGGQSESVQFTGLTQVDDPVSPPVPDEQIPTPVNRPTLSVATSELSAANPGFRQFDNSQPVHWYLQWAETGTENETAYATYTGTDTSTGVANPLFGATTWSGNSEEAVDDGSGFHSDAVTSQLSNGSWSGTFYYYDDNDPDQDFSDSVNYCAFNPDSSGMTVVSPTEQDLFSDYPGDSGKIVLSNEYTTGTFIQQVYNALPALSAYNPCDLGATIASRELLPDSSSLSVQEATYQFNCASTGTVPYVFEWYEVFQPDDASQPIQVTHQEWDDANLQSQSGPYHLNSSSQQSGTANGQWYIARLDTSTQANCPECQWRHNIGIGERVTLRLIGLPTSLSGAATWTASSSVGTLSTTTGEIVTFTAARIPEAQNVTITAGLPGGATMLTTLTIKVPTGVSIKKIASISYPPWDIGAGMWCQYTFAPADVSFSNCEYVERSCSASNCSGYFAHFGGPIHNPNPSGTDSNAYNWIPIRTDNTAFSLDHASAGPLSAAFALAYIPFCGGSGFSWNIPVVYRCDLDTDNGVQLQTVTQTMTIRYSDCEVRKGDADEDQDNFTDEP